MVYLTARPRRVLGCAVAILVIVSFGCTSADGDAGASASASTPAEAPVTEPAATSPTDTEPPAIAPAGTTATTLAAPPTDPPATDPPSTDPPSTDPPSTDPSGTEPPAARDLSFLWNDPDDMVEVWDGANAALDSSDPAVVRLELVPADLTIAGLASAGDGFAAMDVFPAGFLSGTIDPGGEVSALVTTLDPADATARSVLATSLDALVRTWADLGIDGDSFSSAVDAAYGELTSTAAPLGEQRFVQGPDGLTYAAVLTVFEDFLTAAPVVEIAVIPLPDEEVALTVVELLRLELRAVTG